VTTPLAGNPKAVMTDWLPTGEPTAWRLGKSDADPRSARHDDGADPAVSACTVARVWNFALGKGDIVATLSTVPPR